MNLPLPGWWQRTEYLPSRLFQNKDLKSESCMAVFVHSCLAAKEAGKCLISAGSVLCKHMFLERVGNGRGLMGLALIHNLLLKLPQQMCCCAGKTNGTSALLLPDGWWTFPTPSLEPDLHRHGHPAHPRSLGLQIQQSNLPSVSCLLTCLCLELPCGAVSPHSWARGWLWGALGFCRRELEPPDLQTARWVSWWAAQAGMVALGIHWVLDNRFSCFTSDCYHWTLRTLEHKS